LSDANVAVRDRVTGVILAGGRATRMGGMDKGLVPIHGRSMIAWVIDALRPQVSDLLINANRNHDRYGDFACPVIDDGDSEFRGPLAGMVSAMQAARTPYIAVVPCDSPLIGGELVERLYAAAASSGSPIAAAHDGERLQPVFALLSCDLLDRPLVRPARVCDSGFQRRGGDVRQHQCTGRQASARSGAHAACTALTTQIAGYE
jgi:molybdopterin-guanine dinucleotide biosynthesis protein A